MITFKNFLSAISDVLNEAQKVGFIKEYTLTYTENCTESLQTEKIISKFLNIVNDSSDVANIISQLPSENISKIKETPETEHENNLAGKKSLVQIQVDGNEIKRRIDAFITRKRKEVDEWNVQEFCSRPYIDEQNPVWEELNSCARVDTIFVPRSGCKSHVKVSTVENRWGPQTHKNTEAKKIKQDTNDDVKNQLNDASLHAIEERLQSMESHLKLKSEKSRINIFQRLKNLEDRILFLESISPDYFHLPGTDYQSPKKKSFSEKSYSNWSVNDIQKRMQTLKECLKMKAYHIKSELPE